MKKPAESLDAGICTLRRARVADAMQLKDAVDRSLEHLRPWMPWISEEPTTLAQREELLAKWESNWDGGTEFNYLIEHDARVVGCCGLMARVGPGALEIGYWVSAESVGRGLGTAAAGALTTAGLAVDGIEEVVIFHDEANTASGRVPEKLGYARSGKRFRAPEAPGESGVLLRWVLKKPG